jgi:hypothetical protein
MMYNPKPLGIRQPKKEKYTVAAAKKRQPPFGWNCTGDMITADVYMRKAGKWDYGFVYQSTHIEKLHRLGISPHFVLELFKKYWPRERHEDGFVNSSNTRIVEYYVDAPDGPGLESKGKVHREENSDGSWLHAYDATPFKVLKNWQWIADSNQLIHDNGLLRYGDRQFERLFGRLTEKPLMSEINRGKIPLKKFARQVYIPKAAMVLRYEGQTVFNIWRESAMEPDFGDVKWFLDHVAIMFPDKADQQHLLNFMAQLVQHPEVKIHFAILLQSIEGAGKGALAKILKRIIGDRNVVEPSNDEVLKTFTGWQEGAQLAIINELMADGRKDVLNRLKSPITEDTLRIEKKFGNTFTIPNHMNLFCMTNFKNALSLAEGDRRWLVLYSPAAKQSVEYYNQLFGAIADDSKVAAVMEFLLNWEISFNPKAPAPFTAAKADMQDRAQGDTEADLQTAYDAGGWPFDHPLVRVADLVASIRHDNKNARNVHKDAMAFLDHVKAAKLRRYKEGRHGLAPVQLYAIRDHAMWMAAKPIDAARAYHAQRTEDADNNPEWDS